MSCGHSVSKSHQKVLLEFSSKNETFLVIFKHCVLVSRIQEIEIVNDVFCWLCPPPLVYYGLVLAKYVAKKSWILHNIDNFTRLPTNKKSWETIDALDYYIRILTVMILRFLKSGKLRFLLSKLQQYFFL